MRTAAIIQARMGSTRLPGKIAKPLSGKPMLEHVILRVRAARGVDVVCVATTKLERDDWVAEQARAVGAEVFRGSEDDVLSRYAGAARMLDAAIVVRVTSDCPFYDPSLLDEMLEARARLIAETGPVDYYSNCVVRTYPRGLDTEIVPLETLFLTDREATSPRDREHVMPFLWSQPERFRLSHHINGVGDWSDLRWTVDTPEDFELATCVYEALYPADPLFGRKAIHDLFAQRPELSKINADVRQKVV